jgi:hypothetical protein
MEIATENEDQKLVWFIWGRVIYTLIDFEPIEIAYLENQSTMDVFVNSMQTIT